MLDDFVENGFFWPKKHISALIVLTALKVDRFRAETHGPHEFRVSCVCPTRSRDMGDVIELSVAWDAVPATLIAARRWSAAMRFGRALAASLLSQLLVWGFKKPVGLAVGTAVSAGLLLWGQHHLHALASAMFIIPAQRRAAELYHWLQGLTIVRRMAPDIATGLQVTATVALPHLPPPPLRSPLHRRSRLCRRGSPN